MAVNPVPEGRPALSPYLIVPGVLKLLDFLKETFDAEVTHPPMIRPNGQIGHTEVRIGDSYVMMGESSDQWPAIPGSLHLYVKDIDATYARALAAGAESIMPPADQFYGDRSAGVKDPSGNCWWIASHKKDISHEELTQRAATHGK